MRMPLTRYLPLLIVSLFISACKSDGATGYIRNDLFSLGYGAVHTQLAIPSLSGKSIDLEMREGIFYLLDRNSKKILRLSSYGDFLSVLYDPSSNQTPSVANAYPLRLTEPSHVAVNSWQMHYIVDRLEDPANRVFDKNSETYCDHIIRIISAEGEELPWLGQEGISGTPFPEIVNLEIQDDDSIAVVSVSEKRYLIHHFSSSGTLLSLFKIERDTLPVPEELVKSISAQHVSTIHANVDSITCSLDSGIFKVILKLDYYKETADPSSGVVSKLEYAGSWIFSVEGLNEVFSESIPILSDGDDTIPSLIGLRNKKYFLLSRSTSSNSALLLTVMDSKGVIQAKYRLEMPKKSREVVDISVATDERIIALLYTDDKAEVAWWYSREGGNRTP